jgi:hypothetical protein
VNLYLNATYDRVPDEEKRQFNVYVQIVIHLLVFTGLVRSKADKNAELRDNKASYKLMCSSLLPEFNFY